MDGLTLEEVEGCEPEGEGGCGDSSELGGSEGDWGREEGWRGWKKG